MPRSGYALVVSPSPAPPTYLDADRVWVDSRLRYEVGLRVEGPALARLGARGQRCVEVGTGRRGLGARCAATLMGAGEVVAYDVHPASVTRARGRTADLGDRVRVEVGDATALPEADASADLVVSFHALHHIEDWRAAVGECARVLRPGGRLAIAEMTSRFIDAPWLRAVAHHPREDRFGAEELLAALREHGLGVRGQDVVSRLGGRWLLLVATRA